MSIGYIQSFELDNGKRVVLRSLEREDLTDLVELYNSVVVEDVDVPQDRTITVDEGKELMEDMLDRMKRGKALALVAEIDGKVIANSTVVWKSGRMSHVAEVGATIHKNYRNKGIGTKMIGALIQLSKERGLKMLMASIFSTNKGARCLSGKLSFKEVAILPKMFYKKGNYIDEVIVVLELEK